MLLELASLLKHDLDKERAGGGDPLGKAVVERLHIRDFRPGHTHRTCEPHPVEIGVPEIERTFEVLLSDEAIVYQHWKRLIVERRVTGRRVFDARLVAVMLAHGGAQLLTFNAADFAGLGVPVLEPQAVR